MILSAAFLPLLIDALKTTVRNATAATATQLASEQLDAVSAPASHLCRTRLV